MTAQAVETLLAQLTNAGLRLSLAADGGLAVSPASRLTTDLRTLIHSNKPLLIDWLTTANEGANQAPAPFDEHVNWKAMAAPYHAHHFNCPACTAAGRGNRYGQRCVTGIALWLAYCEKTQRPLPSPYRQESVIALKQSSSTATGSDA